MTIALMHLDQWTICFVLPIPFVVRREVVSGNSEIRTGMAREPFSYITNFPWFPDAPVADVISAARIRRS